MAERVTVAPSRMLGPGAVLRGLLRPRPLAWFVGLLAVSVAVESLPYGPASVAGKVLWFLTAGIPLRVAARQQRRLHEAEQLHRRAPRRADPVHSPRPTQAASSRRARLLRMSAVLAWAIAVGALVGTPFMALHGDQGFLGLPAVTNWVLGPVAAIVLVVEGRAEWRRGVAGAEWSVPDLPRSTVTLLGFTGPGGIDVVLVPGEVTVPTDPSKGEYDTVLAGALGGRPLGDLVPGDVLVCDGVLEAGAEVALSDGTATAWTGTLRTIPGSDLGPPQTFREALREADAETERDLAEQRAREERFERSLGQRQAAYERDVERRRAELEARLADRDAPRPDAPTP